MKKKTLPMTTDTMPTTGKEGNRRRERRGGVFASGKEDYVGWEGWLIVIGDEEHKKSREKCDVAFFF